MLHFPLCPNPRLSGMGVSRCRSIYAVAVQRLYAADRKGSPTLLLGGSG
jgi:hypothetical protein